MKRPRLLVIGISLLACGSLAMRSPAVAEPITVEDFTATLTSASAASGVFAPGTTIVSDGFTIDGGIVGIAINPDGSATMHQSGFDVRADVKCMRVDRCWVRSQRDYDDSKWHRMPPGAVRYELASAWWAELVEELMEIDWADGSTFDATTSTDGTQVFTASEPIGEDVGTYTFTVAPNHVTVDVMVHFGDGGQLRLLSASLTPRVEPVVIKPPAQGTVGAPASSGDRWLALINN